MPTPTPTPTQTTPAVASTAPRCRVNDRGFGLIEALVAMSLIAGAYIGVLECYHRLYLKYGQLQTQTILLHQEKSRYEGGAP